MSRLKVAVTDYVFPDLSLEEQILSAANADLVAAQCSTATELVALARDADGILNTYYGPLDESVFKCCANLKIVVRFGIGVDTIDIPAATRHGIMVANVPDYCLDEVSDHAVGLWLTVTRKIAMADRHTRVDQWDVAGLRPIPRLRGQTAGIVGFGRIGRLTARKLSVFGVEVLFADPCVTADVTLDGQVCRKVELTELFERADAVFLHAPATAETHHLLNADAFGQMLRNPVVINTARGELVNTDALTAALADGQISGAGLDVLDEGHLASDHPLWARDNVVVTPHSAWYSTEGIGALRRLATEEVVRGIHGERPRSLLNPEVLER